MAEILAERQEIAGKLDAGKAELADATAFSAYPCWYGLCFPGSGAAADPAGGLIVGVDDMVVAVGHPLLDRTAVASVFLLTSVRVLFSSNELNPVHLVPLLLEKSTHEAGGISPVLPELLISLLEVEIIHLDPDVHTRHLTSDAFGHCDCLLVVAQVNEEVQKALRRPAAKAYLQSTLQPEQEGWLAATI
jgi:hypothetical protein